jgi:hypothetical protein
MKIKKNELFFFLGLLLFLIKSFIDSSIVLNNFNKYEDYLLFFSYLCFVINILINIDSELLKNIRNIRSIINYRNFYVCFFYIYSFSFYNININFSKVCGYR